MPVMDHIHWPGPGGRVTLWGGPADGQPWNVDLYMGQHPDVEVPMKSQTLPGVVPDETWRPTSMVAVYRYNAQTDRYEYAGQVNK